MAVDVVLASGQHFRVDGDSIEAAGTSSGRSVTTITTDTPFGPVVLAAVPVDALVTKTPPTEVK